MFAQTGGLFLDDQDEDPDGAAALLNKIQVES